MNMTEWLFECPQGHVFLQETYDDTLVTVCWECMRYSNRTAAEHHKLYGSTYAERVIDSTKNATFRLAGSLGVRALIEKEKKIKYPTPCTYHPILDRIAKWYEVHAEAAWLITMQDLYVWKLCDKCAVLPRFCSRYKKVPI